MIGFGSIISVVETGGFAGNGYIRDGVLGVPLGDDLMLDLALYCIYVSKAWVRGSRGKRGL